MPDISINPGRLNITGWHGDKYNIVFNKKNTVTGAAENVTGDYKFSVRKKGNTVNDVQLTAAPGITINASQLIIKMDSVLALAAGEYDIQLSVVDGAVDRILAIGNLTIKPSL